jgi:hypothetical protein
MKRWFKFWAKYSFAYAIVSEEEYVYMEDEGNKAVREAVYEWAADTQNGQAILATGYRRFKYGFRRVDSLPWDVRAKKIQHYTGMVAYYRELLFAAQEANTG